MDNTTQEPVPFLVSVEENTGYGLREDNLSKDNIIKAAKAENAHEVTISLPQATSALDAFSERLVQDALNLLMKGRTTLVIAHRLSTVQNSHQIAHSSNGQTAELGTHFDLLGKGAICFISRHPKTDIEYY